MYFLWFLAVCSWTNYLFIHNLNSPPSHHSRHHPLPDPTPTLHSTPLPFANTPRTICGQLLHVEKWKTGKRVANTHLLVFLILSFCFNFSFLLPFKFLVHRSFFPSSVVVVGVFFLGFWFFVFFSSWNCCVNNLCCWCCGCAASTIFHSFIFRGTFIHTYMYVHVCVWVCVDLCVCSGLYRLFYISYARHFVLTYYLWFSFCLLILLAFLLILYFFLFSSVLPFV